MVDAMKSHAYQSAMAQTRILLEQGFIDQADLVTIENLLAEKYEINNGSIYREIDLINVTFRANMVYARG